MITLTSEQHHAIKLVKKWFNSKSERKIPFILSGPAGSGKTVLATNITPELGLKEHQVRFCSYTGKSSLVMRKKGMPATTIHSLIYEPRTDERKRVFFQLKSSLGTDVKLILCDESSMIGKIIQADLESFGIPILYIGDGNQLPPISEDITNLMLTPNFRLETIHRQALENPIIWIATQIRKGKYIKHGKYGSTVLKTNPSNIGIETLKKADQIICGKNVTRRNINSQMRDYYGFTSIFPQEKDKLICLKNNSQNGLINGMSGICLYYNEKKNSLDFRNDEEESYLDLTIDKSIFEGVQSEKWKKDIESFDFGYCITGHKAQASQYENVIVYEERLGDQEFHNRWLYTCVTRSSEKLIILS